jgi:tripartite-type tricarboxylate transporter receptor subunit TctC
MAASSTLRHGATYRCSQPCNVPPCIETGSIRIIAAINDGRSKYFPDVPTMAQQGFAEAQVTPWFGIVIPAGTAPPIVDRISKGWKSHSLQRTCSRSSTLRDASRRGATGAVRRHHQGRFTLWTKVVKDAGIAAD